MPNEPNDLTPLSDAELAKCCDLTRNGPTLVRIARELVEARKERERLHTLRPALEYHEDMGFVLWHHLPIQEPPEISTGVDEIHEGYPDGWHTHFSPLPDCNLLQDKFLAGRDAIPGGVGVSVGGEVKGGKA